MKAHLTALSNNTSFATSSLASSPRPASVLSSPGSQPLPAPRSACISVSLEATGSLVSLQILVSATFANGQPVRILQAFPVAAFHTNEEEPERDGNSPYVCQHLMDSMIRLSHTPASTSKAPPPALLLSLSLHASPRDSVKLCIDVMPVKSKAGSSSLLGKVLAGSSRSDRIRGDLILPALPHRSMEDLRQSPQMGPRPPRRRLASEMKWSPRTSALQNLPEELERSIDDAEPDLTSTPSTGSISSIATPTASLLDEPWQPTAVRQGSKDSRSSDSRPSTPPDWALRLAKSRSN